MFCNRKVNFDHFCYGYCSAGMFQSALLYLLTQKAAQKFGYVLGIGDDKRVSVTIRRFHSLRSFHPRLFTFAPFGDGRMLLAKLQLMKYVAKIVLSF